VVVRGGVGSCVGPLYRREKVVGRPGFEHEELVRLWRLRKYPVVDSAREAPAGIRGGVTAALWTRPVEQGRADCGSVERRRSEDGGSRWCCWRRRLGQAE
jgi:hypothetical protein